MGVKDLWSILSPVCEKKSLWELENQSIAIDLSAWICDSQNVTRTSPHINMYLRNLFFRTSYLLLLGVKPVFVLEGDAPELKAATMQKRMGKGEEGSQKAGSFTRARLKGLQKQCVDLLSHMGIACVRGPGEAEAFCAHLNEQGIVSGVITQDSDAFLYGAREVYRHFQMGPSYTCDCYRMDTIEQKLSLSRTKLIGYSILCGSDYNNGVSKLGKQSALKFLKSIEDNQVYQKFIQWRNITCFDELKNDKYISSDLQFELIIREKALKDPGFPHLDVIAEFTTPPEKVDFTWNWSKPDLHKFLEFAMSKLAWDEEYALDKFIPLMGRWHLLHPHMETLIFVKSIQGWRKKNEAGSSFKVEWSLKEHDIKPLSTWELETNVNQEYSSLVESYKDSKKKKAVKSNTEKKKTKNTKTKVLEVQQNQKKIDKYVVRAKPKQKRKSFKLGTSVNDELNLSGILKDIVSREVSNPVLLRDRGVKHLL